MKKLGLVLLGVLIICFSTLPVHALIVDVTATFIPADDPIEVGVGDSFGVEVYAQGDMAWGDLTGFGFTVATAGLTHFSYDGFTIGPDYDDVSPLANPDKIEGFLGLSAAPNAGENVLLATISFTALSIGTDLLDIDGLFNIFDNSGLYYSDFFTGALTDGDLTGTTNLSAVSAVPEPTTILLLGSGLLGLAGLRRRFIKS